MQMQNNADAGDDGAQVAQQSAQYAQSVIKVAQ
jgi:hypothetical protein